jgi:hypothetical protein
MNRFRTPVARCDGGIGLLTLTELMLRLDISRKSTQPSSQHYTYLAIDQYRP